MPLERRKEGNKGLAHESQIHLLGVCLSLFLQCSHGPLLWGFLGNSSHLRSRSENSLQKPSLVLEKLSVCISLALISFSDFTLHLSWQISVGLIVVKVANVSFCSLWEPSKSWKWKRKRQWCFFVACPALGLLPSSHSFPSQNTEREGSKFSFSGIVGKTFTRLEREILLIFSS